MKYLLDTNVINGLILATHNVRDFDGFGIPVLNPFE